MDGTSASPLTAATDMPIHARQLLHFLRTSEIGHFAIRQVSVDLFPLAAISVMVSKLLTSHLRLQPTLEGSVCTDRSSRS